MNARAFVAVAALTLIPALSLPAERAPAYPAIRVLSLDDSLFVQQQAELADFRQVSEAHGPIAYPDVDLFQYKRHETEDLFGLNARLGIRYDTLATLNGASNPDGFNSLGTVLIPSQDGLFVNDPPRGTLEDMVLSARIQTGAPHQRLVIARGTGSQVVTFFPGERFTPLERSYFLGVLLEFPVVHGVITSLYGERRDPFTGALEFHGGVDIGAPEGSEVRAAREGTVLEEGTNTMLGNYIILEHAQGYETVYGHLSSFSVKIHEEVATGAVIGRIGHTGHATGPHLHFELLRKGSLRDPMPLLASKKG